MSSVYDFGVLTGDPFVEAGRRIIINRAGKAKLNDNDITNAVNWALTHYVDKWDCKLHAAFLNSSITQPAFKGRQKQETRKYFKSIIEKSEPYGICQVCGRKSVLHNADRSNMPLTGSNTNPNFGSYLRGGTKICSECMIGLFFMPFALMKVGGMCLLIHTESSNIFDLWIENTLKLTVGSLDSKGIADAKMKHHVKNQLYYFANQIVMQLEEDDLMGSLNFYHFTNFGASPTCDFMSIPKGLILFLKEVRNNDLDGMEGMVFSARARGRFDEWNKFVYKNYRMKGSKIYFDEERGNFFEKSKGGENQVDKDEAVQSYNPVIDRLLNGESILSYMRTGRVSFKIAGIYCKEVLKMDKERVKAVMQLADNIVELIEANDNSKLLVNIEKAGSVNEFRGALRKMMRLYINTDAKKPLFTTEEYLYKIMPEGENWMDCRDLVLIRLYEKLHDWLKNRKKDKENDNESGDV